LDFYYGYIGPPDNTDIPNYQKIGYGLYFTKEKNPDSMYKPYQDYNSIDGIFLRKFMSYDEFLSDIYKVTNTQREGRIFGQHSFLPYRDSCLEATEDNLDCKFFAYIILKIKICTK